MSLPGWDADKKLRLTIAATDVDSALTDFPALVNLGTSSGKSSLDASAVFDELTSDANRKKIAIEIGDTGNQCYCEIEWWDDANETAQLHVKVPSLSSSADTILYLYYDSSHADNTSYVGDTGDTPAQSVWDSNFRSVYHMAQDPTGGGACILDSTSGGYHGTPNGSMTSGDLVDGLIGKALDFDGTDDHISCPNTALQGDNASFTLEMYMYSRTDVNCFVSKWDFATSRRTLLFGRIASTDKPTLKFYDTGVEGSTSMSLNTWYGVAGTLTISGTAIKIYLDGIEDGSGSSAGYLRDTNDNNFLIGKYSSTYADGLIREVRVSHSVRSADWIEVTDLSLTDELITFSLLGVADRHISAFVDFPKQHNHSFMPDFVPAGVIRQNRKGFSKPF